MRLDDWFLTDAERGNAVAPRIHGVEYFAGLVEEVSALEEGGHLWFTDWRADADELMGPDGPTVGGLFGDAAKRGVLVKGLVWRSHHERMSYSEEQNRPPRRRRRRGGRGGAARPAGAPRGVAPPEAGRDPGRRPGRGVRRRHRPVPLPPRRRRPPRRPADRAHGGGLRRPPAAARRPARAAGTGGRAARRRVPGALDRPAVAGHRQPDLLPRGPAAPRRPHPGPAAGPAAGPRAGRAVRGAGAAHLPGDPPADAVRPARGALGRPRLRQGVPARAAADLPGGPVHVVPAHRRAAGRRAAAPPRAPPRRGGAPAPGRRRAPRAAAQPGGPAGGPAGHAAGRAGPGARVRPGEPRRHAGVRARQALRDRRRLGLHRQREPQPALVEPRQRAVVRGAGRHARRAGGPATPAASATAPAAAPATCGCGCGASTSTGNRATTRTCSTRDAAVAAVSAAADRLDAWHRGGRVGARPPGRLRPHRPEKLPPWTRGWAVPVYRVVYDPDGRSVRDRLRGRW